MVFSTGPTDPFYELMHPPPDETSAQKAARLKRELDAQRVSDSIDESIKQEYAKEKEKGKKDVIKVLLLGQAESGEYPLPRFWHYSNSYYSQENLQRSKVRFLFSFVLSTNRLYYV